MSSFDLTESYTLFEDFDRQQEDAHKKAEVEAAIRAVERRLAVVKLSTQVKKSRVPPDEVQQQARTVISSVLPSWLADMCVDYYRLPFPCKEEIEGITPAIFRRYQVLLQIESKSSQPAPFMQCYQFTFFAESTTTGMGLSSRNIISGVDAPYNKHNELFSARWNRSLNAHPADIGDGETDVLPYRNSAREQLRVPHKLNIPQPFRRHPPDWDDYANFREWDFYCLTGTTFAVHYGALPLYTLCASVVLNYDNRCCVFVVGIRRIADILD